MCFKIKLIIKINSKYFFIRAIRYFFIVNRYPGVVWCGVVWCDVVWCGVVVGGGGGWCDGWWVVWWCSVVKCGVCVHVCLLARGLTHIMQVVMYNVWLVFTLL